MLALFPLAASVHIGFCEGDGGCSGEGLSFPVLMDK